MYGIGCYALDPILVRGPGRGLPAAQPATKRCKQARSEKRGVKGGQSKVARDEETIGPEAEETAKGWPTTE